MIGLCCENGKLVDGSVDGAVVVAIEIIHRLYYLLRLLSCRCGVKIDERLSLHRLLQNGKVIAKFFKIRTQSYNGF